WDGVSSSLPGADLQHIYELMCAYDVSANEWKRYELWDETKKYTRNLIATDDATFTLMLLCWNPQLGSPVHNHAGSECFMRVVEGAVEEVQYDMIAGDGLGEEKHSMHPRQTTT